MSSTIKPFVVVQPRRNILDGAGRRFGRWLLQAWRAYTTRAALAQLDDRALQDLGISRAQARFEAGRPFWDVDHRGLPRR